jgi:hypothetical protein
MAAEMTKGSFALEKGLERIVSPITLIFPDHSKTSFKNGTELSVVAFDHPYRIKSIAAVDDEIGIILEEGNIDGNPNV